MDNQNNTQNQQNQTPVNYEEICNKLENESIAVQKADGSKIINTGIALFRALKYKKNKDDTSKNHINVFKTMFKRYKDKAFAVFKIETKTKNDGTFNVYGKHKFSDLELEGKVNHKYFETILAAALKEGEFDIAYWIVSQMNGNEIVSKNNTNRVYYLFHPGQSNKNALLTALTIRNKIVTKFKFLDPKLIKIIALLIIKTSICEQQLPLSEDKFKKYKLQLQRYLQLPVIENLIENLNDVIAEYRGNKPLAIKIFRLTIKNVIDWKISEKMSLQLNELEINYLKQQNNSLKFSLKKALGQNKQLIMSNKIMMNTIINGGDELVIVRKELKAKRTEGTERTGLKQTAIIMKPKKSICLKIAEEKERRKDRNNNNNMDLS